MQPSDIYPLADLISHCSRNLMNVPALSGGR
jgi:hypothetical protein